jgi:hypothetical protein
LRCMLLFKVKQKWSDSHCLTLALLYLIGCCTFRRNRPLITATKLDGRHLIRGQISSTRGMLEELSLNSD